MRNKKFGWNCCHGSSDKHPKQHNEHITIHTATQPKPDLIWESETQEGETSAWIQEEKNQETQTALTHNSGHKMHRKSTYIHHVTDRSKKHYFSWPIFW